MKCVQHQQTGEIVRVDDFEAKMLVDINPNWKYCPKRLFKAQEAAKKQPSRI